MNVDRVLHHLIDKVDIGEGCKLDVEDTGIVLAALRAATARMEYNQIFHDAPPSEQVREAESAFAALCDKGGEGKP